MDRAILRKVQLTQLEILKEFKRVCDENGLKYWLDSGTCLGAVRHGGFIPWDDDIDVGMLRDDYEKFIEIYPQKGDEKYSLHCWKTDKTHSYPFAKLRKVGTKYLESRDDSKGNCGIYIDIFPYDKMPLDKKLQRKQNVDVINNIALLKNGIKKWRESDKIDWKKWWQMLPMRFMALFVSLEKARKIYDKKHTMYNDMQGGYVYIPAGASRYGRWIINAEWVDNVVDIRFEDDVFKGVRDVDAYLTKQYGDYMQLPPEEKRWVGHSILEVDFGEKEQ